MSSAGHGIAAEKQSDKERIDMKKRLIMVLMIAAFSVAAAACGSSKSEETTAAPETEVQEETEAEAEVSEDGEEISGGAVGGMVTDDGEYIEEVFVDGKITRIEGDVVTIASSEGSTLSFDISGAGVTAEERADILEGAYVETAYLDAPDAQQPYASSYMIVLMNLEEQADAEGVNPTFSGTITYVDINEIIMRDANGAEVSFDNSMARDVTFSTVAAGSKAQVTYMGSIYRDNQISTEEGTGSGTPVAIKVVTEDAVNSEEAAANYIAGPVSDITEDTITVDTSYASFTFNADPSMLSGIEQENSVTVYYEGALSDERSVQAVSITKGA